MNLQMSVDCDMRIENKFENRNRFITCHVIRDLCLQSIHFALNTNLNGTGTCRAGIFELFLNDCMHICMGCVGEGTCIYINHLNTAVMCRLVE